MKSLTDFIKQILQDEPEKQEYTLSRAKILEIYQGVKFIVYAEVQKAKKEILEELRTR